MGKNTVGERIFAPEVMVSNDTRQTGLNNNDLIIGGSGSGKTGGYIYNLLLHPHGSMIVSDTKGLLHRIFAEYLRSLGYQVYVLDFVNPEQSVGYNPLNYIRRNEFGEPNEADIKKLATIIMPMLDSHEPFWEKVATRYISILIAFVLESAPRKEQTIESVCMINRKMQTSRGKEIFEQWMSENPDSYSARKYKEILQSSKADKMWSSIQEFANQALDVFDYKEYRPIWDGKRNIDIARMGHKKTVLFLNSSDHDTSMHALCEVFHSQAMQVLIEEADRM